MHRFLKINQSDNIRTYVYYWAYINERVFYFDCLFDCLQLTDISTEEPNIKMIMLHCSTTSDDILRTEIMDTWTQSKSVSNAFIFNSLTKRFIVVWASWLYKFPNPTDDDYSIIRLRASYNGWFLFWAAIGHRIERSIRRNRLSSSIKVLNSIWKFRWSWNLKKGRKWHDIAASISLRCF